MPVMGPPEATEQEGKELADKVFAFLRKEKIISEWGKMPISNLGEMPKFRKEIEDGLAQICREILTYESYERF